MVPSIRPPFVRAFLAAFAIAIAGAASARTPYADRPEVIEFANQIAKRHKLEAASILKSLRQAKHQATIVRWMEPLPPSQRSWKAYAGRTLTSSRIDEGVQFWTANQAALVRAHERFGIPPEIIVSIIGVETNYGKNTGSWRVLDALTTLAFDYPRRGAFFRSELEYFFVYAKETGTDVEALKGSYAGALGIPQFMPGSYLRYAIDFDGDGRRDLVNNVVDAIGSVGNFLSEHGWQPNEPVAFPVSLTGEAHQLPLSAGIEPRFRVGELDQYGITLNGAALNQPVNEDALCALIEFETPNKPSEFWIGLKNFYVITRYNQSSFYAMSVNALAEAVKAKMSPPIQPVPPPGQ
ncbi:MAG: lytic murein transglycosylase B [Betaproteobacteria bacterium]|nr:lytic murein transglycosylase B [Betaproteobacteria bacterium]